MIIGGLLIVTGAVLLYRGRRSRTRSPGAPITPGARTAPPPSDGARTVVDRVRRAAKAVVEPFSATIRQEQLEQLGEAEGVHDTAAARRQLGLASLTLGGTVAGVVVWPLLLLPSIGLMAWMYAGTARRAVSTLREERTLGQDMLMTVCVGGVVLSGKLVIGAFGLWIGRLMRWLLSNAEVRSRVDLVDLFGERPETVRRLVDGIEVETPFDAIEVGDILILDAGQTVPIDGTAVHGYATVDQHTLTGESHPVEVEPGRAVLASTILVSGRVHVRVERTGSETTSARIGTILAQASSIDPDKRQQLLEDIDRGVPWMFGLSVASLPFVGGAGALAVLWYSPGLRMMVFGPMLLLNYLHIFARRGILVKSADGLEHLADVDTVIFDKTGTLTLAEPILESVHPRGPYAEDVLLGWAAAVEANQGHPVAEAIRNRAAAAGVRVPDIDDPQIVMGYGLSARIDGHDILIGSERFMELSGVALGPRDNHHIEDNNAQGLSTVLMAVDGALAALFDLRPRLRPEAAEVISTLRSRGMTVFIVSGDSEPPTRQLAEALSVDGYRARALPGEKAEFVREQQSRGRTVCFVGDGINDAIALEAADVSISLADATRAATAHSQIVLMTGGLRQLPDLFEIGAGYRTSQRVALGSTVVPNMLGILATFALRWSFGAAIVVNSALWFPQLLWVASSLWRWPAEHGVDEDSPPPAIPVVAKRVEVVSKDPVDASSEVGVPGDGPAR